MTWWSREDKGALLPGFPKQESQGSTNPQRTSSRGHRIPRRSTCKFPELYQKRVQRNLDETSRHRGDARELFRIFMEFLRNFCTNSRVNWKTRRTIPRVYRLFARALLNSRIRFVTRPESFVALVKISRYYYLRRRPVNYTWFRSIAVSRSLFVPRMKLFIAAFYAQLSEVT